VLTGPRRPGRPTAGPRPLFAIGEAAAAGRSSAVHTELMMTSACRATVGPRRRDQSGGRPRWRGAASGHEPGPAGLLA